MTLKELIDSEPANAGRTDQEVLDWLKESVAVWIDVEWLDFQVWRHQQGVTQAVLKNVADGANATRATAAQYMLDVVDAGEVFAASDSRVRQLIADAALPAAMQSSLQAIAQEQRPRWSQTELGQKDDVSWLFHISEART